MSTDAEPAEYPTVTIKIKPGSPMAAGRLPKRRTVEPDGSVMVVLDPVAWAALMATIGQPVQPVRDVTAWMLQRRTQQKSR